MKWIMLVFIVTPPEAHKEYKLQGWTSKEICQSAGEQFKREQTVLGRGVWFDCSLDYSTTPTVLPTPR